jgi:hypothetical protein
VGSVKRRAPIYHRTQHRVAKSSPVHEALILLGVIAALLAGIVPFVYLSIRELGQARLLQPATKETHPGQHRLASLHGLWATHFRFEWIGGYQFRGLDRRFIAAWRHAEQPVFLQLQLIKGATHYELLSVFNREQTLTSTTAIAIVPPTPPGSFVQRYPDATLTELFRHHASAHDFLVGGGHVKLEPHAVRFDRALIDVLARTHAFVTALSAWPLRGVAWVLVGPRRARNRSVAEQLAFQNAGSETAATEPDEAMSADENAALNAATATPKKAPRAAEDEGDAPIDDAMAAEIESLVAKTATLRRGSAEARRKPSDKHAPDAPPAAPARPNAPRPAPRAGRTR